MKLKVVKILLKIALSVAAIYYVATSLDYRLIKEAVGSARPGWLVLALVLYALSQVAAAWRLNRLFREIPLVLTHLENLKLYWLGLFYNLFLPGGVGGDGFKIYLLANHHKAPVRKLIGTVLSDRISGLSVILIFLMGLFPLIDYNFPCQQYTWLLMPLVLLAFYLFLLLFNKTLMPAFVPTVLWALASQIIQMGAAVMILFSLGIRGDYENYLFLFFLSAIMGSIPITLGGIGAREVTFLFGAQYLGINETNAVALSILFYAASAIVSLPGIIYTLKPLDILESRTTQTE